MTVDNIVEAVKVNMDEIAANDADFMLEQDNAEMITIIKQKIAEAYLYILKNAREDLIDDSLKTSTAITMPSTATSNYYIDISLSAVDYLRLILVRLSTWAKAVKFEDFIEEGDDNEARVMDQISGASWERPAVIYMQSENALRLVGVKSTQVGSCKLVYIATPQEQAEATADYDLGEKLNGALINYITGLVWVTYNENARAEAMFDLALSAMGIETNKQ